ncbi:RNA polymerase sigma factor [Peristeroidobacter soli]|jgi:RNA polymerase sigma-70 factor (ECF subfamily)|uniref:RNA polymerase sigma factor n=1 Tax=Peristeroidobacter soli TaxID=2497877 RepID=UPI0013009957|nr:RNA polymerase sigma factor [Peristeroidobacter soli]
MSHPDRPSYVAAIADRYGRRLRRFLSVRLRNAAEVPDLAQEVFLRLLRFEDHGNIKNPEAYLFTVASHVIHQHAVRRAAAPIMLDLTDLTGDLQAQSSDDPQHSAELWQRVDALQELLKELPPRLATTLVLAKIGEHSLEEIAAELGVSRESVKKYLARALQFCRERSLDLGTP